MNTIAPVHTKPFLSWQSCIACHRQNRGGVVVKLVAGWDTRCDTNHFVRWKPDSCPLLLLVVGLGEKILVGCWCVLGCPSDPIHECGSMGLARATCALIRKGGLSYENAVTHTKTRSAGAHASRDTHTRDIFRTHGGPTAVEAAKGGDRPIMMKEHTMVASASSTWGADYQADLARIPSSYTIFPSRKERFFKSIMDNSNANLRFESLLYFRRDVVVLVFYRVDEWMIKRQRDWTWRCASVRYY